MLPDTRRVEECAPSSSSRRHDRFRSGRRLSSPRPRARRSPEAADVGAQLGASWMANQITANGGFLKSFGSPDPLNTAYAVIGLHAAKIGGTASAIGDHVSRRRTLGSERCSSAAATRRVRSAYYIMAAVAAGDDPHQFGGTAPRERSRRATARDAAARRVADAGLFGAQFPNFDGTFRQGLALAALKAAQGQAEGPARDVSGITLAHRATVRERPVRAVPHRHRVAVRPARPDQLHRPRHEQHRHGASRASPRSGKKPLKVEVATSLHAVQSSDGGFGFIAAPGQPSDPDSTALVIQGLIAIGNKPSKPAWQLSGGNPYTRARELPTRMLRPGRRPRRVLLPRGRRYRRTRSQPCRPYPRPRPGVCRLRSRSSRQPVSATCPA